ncbi:uncharacterized protein BDV17DRAFT_94910 [Aspergillus undulatus]|uniref:uncharacterized protein n=1 Tax=Aspergillus undulatus TaxID=1810928 RepID=UPI003CCCAD0C
MWGKVPFSRTRKPSGENNAPTTTRVFTSPPSVVTHKRDYSAKALPTLPSVPTVSQFNAHPTEAPRVSSSIYSRDTVLFDHQRQRSISDTYQFPPQLQPPNSADARSQGSRSVDISPPDSPISQIYGRKQSRSVSPIEDKPMQGTDRGAGDKFTSQIPVPRTRVDSQSGQQPSNPAPRANATRWDAYSGEPTTSKQGRTGQVNPSSVSFETHVSTGRAPIHSSKLSNSSKIIGWGKEQLHSRKKTSEFCTNNRPFDETTFVPREPWRGQSGRSPMVYPIQEQPRNRSSSRLRLSRSNDRLREMNNPSPIVGASATFTTTITAGEKNHIRNFQPRTRTYDPREAEATRPRNTSAVSGSAPPRVDLMSQPTFSDSLTDLTLADDDVNEEVNEPPSRFSVTTYDPTEVGSPTPSIRESITPSPPASIIETASQASDTSRSIMSRSRPIPSTTAPGRRPLRKPTPSEVPSTKELPPAPMTAQGRIEILEGKRSELVRRRTNIDTIIHELTQVIQPSSIAYDMAAREEVKKTVASLNNELAEIKKEEHDIGLKILKAWKRRDDEDFYGQSSSLWVSRVAS